MSWRWYAEPEVPGPYQLPGGWRNRRIEVRQHAVLVVEVRSVLVAHAEVQRPVAKDLPVILREE